MRSAEDYAIKPWAKYKDQPFALDGAEPRLMRVASLESMLLLVRYALLILYGILFFRGGEERNPDEPSAFVILGVALLLHNAFAHYVAFTGRRHWYLTSANSVIHIISCTILVTLTGGDASPFAITYFIILLAQVLYAPHFRRTYTVLLLCILGYTAAVIAQYLVFGVAPEILRICIHYLALFLCYELLRNLANLLYTIELGLQSRAQELASSKATLRTILDAADGPIVVYDDNEFITEANARACEFLGCSRDLLLGTRFRQYFFDDGTLPNKLATLKARGEYQGEVIAVLPEGDELNVVISVRSYIREGRRFFVALLHDITEQKHLQEATRSANVELEKINRELQRVDALRNEFYATISQRLRSPLSAILGYTDLLINDELGELNAAQRKALQTCRRSVFRVFGLVDEAFEVKTPVLNRSARDLPEYTARERATSDAD